MNGWRELWVWPVLAGLIVVLIALGPHLGHTKQTNAPVWSRRSRTFSD